MSASRLGCFRPPQFRLSIGIMAFFCVIFSTNFSAFAQDSTIQKIAKIDFFVEPSGLFTETLHSEIQAINDTGARSLGQQTFYYVKSMQELDIVEAYNKKPDGKKLFVNKNAIFAQLPQASSQIAMFSDQRQKTIVFPDVSAGDTIVLTVKVRQKRAQFPGQFMTQAVYPRFNRYQNVEESISVPKAIKLNVENYDVVINRKNDNGRVIYYWNYNANSSLQDHVSPFSVFDTEPRVYVSSFSKLDDLGHAYFAIVHDRLIVTPKVQALADEITAGVTDRRQQAQKIYEWVSAHIRYVAIYFGNGALIPHDPDTIIQNGYGDCKDHVVIFNSLLKAKRIDSEIVLLNSDNSFTLSYLAPVIGQINHAISRIPEFDIYADTTSGFAPFGALPLSEYGKPVVRAVKDGDTYAVVPLLSGDVYSTKLQTESKISSDGKISGTATISATGAASIALRIVAVGIQSVGVERAVNLLFGDGSTGSFDFVSPQTLDWTYSITGHFELEENKGFISGDNFYIPPGLRVLEKAGDGLMGSLDTAKIKKLEKIQCYSGHQEEHLSLQFPSDKQIDGALTDKHIKNENMEFNSHWRHDDHVVSVDRDFTSKINQPFCDKEILDSAIVALDQIWSDYESPISLGEKFSNEHVKTP